jgi:hemerythrin-like domain-containing protein
MLSDTYTSMRQEVVKQLSKIMKNPSNHGQIRHFIERFRPRLVKIATRDSELGVRAAAVELMNYIRQAGMLEPDDIDVIGKLIFDSEPRVRKSLVGFFARATSNETERALKDSIKPIEKEELILLEILNTIVKVALKSLNSSKKTKAEIYEVKENIARRLASLIPSLLRKYSADLKIVIVVLQLEHVLNLGIFEELRQDSTIYAKLLNEISI